MSNYLSNTYIPNISKLYDPSGTKVGWNLSTRNNYAQLYFEGNQLKFKINATSDIMVLSENGITGEFGEATLPIQTGHTGEFLTTDGIIASWADPEIDTLLPDQSGNTGKFLTTDGSDSSWDTPIDAVTSVFGRTGDVVATTDDYTWAQIDKTTSDIADITTKSHTSLSDIGSNTHSQLDSHVSSTSNPHGITQAQLGLELRKGIVSLTAGANSVTFSSAMSASTYTRSLVLYDGSGYNVSFNTLTNKTTAGFDINVPVNCTLEYEAKIIT